MTSRKTGIDPVNKLCKLNRFRLQLKVSEKKKLFGEWNFEVTSSVNRFKKMQKDEVDNRWRTNQSHQRKQHRIRPEIPVLFELRRIFLLQLTRRVSLASLFRLKSLLLIKPLWEVFRPCTAMERRVFSIIVLSFLRITLIRAAVCTSTDCIHASASILERSEHNRTRRD